MIVNGWREAIRFPVLWKPDWTLGELEEVLTQAIYNCIRECFGGGEIKITLSGGLDSSFCLAKIRNIFGPDCRIRTYTIGGYDRHPDIEFALKAATRFDTFQNTIVPTQAEIMEAQDEVHSLWKDEPRELGNVATYMLYKYMAERGVKCVIAHDGIDELLGGYWQHRKNSASGKKEEAFNYFWERLASDHLLLLERKASYFGITVVFPYLQKSVVEYISRIPLSDRTNHRESKIPLRRIAEKYLPEEIIKRKKMGFCSALDQK